MVFVLTLFFSLKREKQNFLFYLNFHLSKIYSLKIFERNIFSEEKKLYFPLKARNFLLSFVHFQIYKSEQKKLNFFYFYLLKKPRKILFRMKILKDQGKID
jgi:hypothetical protein